MAFSSRDVGTVEDQESSSTVLSCDYRDYESVCSGCYDARCVLEMTVDGGSLSICERQGRSRDTYVVAYSRRWRALSRSCMGVFLNMQNLDMPFVRYATEVKYVRRIHEMLRTMISSESSVVNLFRCCLSRPISSFYLIRKVDTWSRLELGSAKEIEKFSRRLS